MRVKEDPEGAKTELGAAIVAQGGNVAKTARELGVSVETVWRWIRVLGLGETVTRARDNHAEKEQGS
jgi:transposase-like protein